MSSITSQQFKEYNAIREVILKDGAGSWTSFRHEGKDLIVETFTRSKGHIDYIVDENGKIIGQRS